MKTRLYTIGLLCSLLFISSCSDRWEQEETVSSGTAELCISRSSFQVAGKPSPLSGEDEITSLRAYRFEEGVLQKVYECRYRSGEMIICRRSTGFRVHFM